ncbi:MAG: hypothetical protein ABI131_12210 [Nostocoides sp.]
MADPDDLTVTLTQDEALVLFELLHRWEDDELVTAPRHHGEQVALWNLSAALEKVMVEPFDADYARLVSEAQMRLAPTN